MLKDRAELEKSLINVMVKNMSKQNSMTVSQGWYMELLEKYNIPITMLSDIISQRKDLSEFNEFILYCITDVMTTYTNFVWASIWCSYKRSIKVKING